MASFSRSIAFVVMFFALPVSAQDIRTINIDFGNGPVYSGFNGVLSTSVLGTHWNKVNVTSFPFGSGIPIQFDIPALLDEFGQPLGAGVHKYYDHYPSPEMTSGFHEGVENLALASQGPLLDGVTLQPNPNFFGFSIRELDPSVPVSLVVYFNEPAGGSQVNTIALGPNYQLPTPLTAIDPTGQFPGIPGRDYLRFDNLVPIPTTLGDPELRGIIIGVPEGVAHIAAIQIRGAFVFAVPEPSSLLLAAVIMGMIANLRLL